MGLKEKYVKYVKNTLQPSGVTECLERRKRK